MVFTAHLLTKIVQTALNPSNLWYKPHKVKKGGINHFFRKYLCPGIRTAVRIRSPSNGQVLTNYIIIL